jgi:hypothetical protein
MYAKDPDRFAENVRQVWKDMVKSVALAFEFLARLFPPQPVEPYQLRLL